MKKGVSSTVAYVIIIAIGLTSAALIYYSVTSTRTPFIKEHKIKIQAYALNSTAIKVLNDDTTNSSSFEYLRTSHGNCVFSSPTILEPGIAEVCVLPSPVANGTVVTIYGEEIVTTKVKF